MKTVVVEGHKVAADIHKEYVDLYSKFEGITYHLRVMANGKEIPYYGGSCASAVTDRMIKGFFNL